MTKRLNGSDSDTKIERQRKAIQEIIDRHRKRYEREIAGLKAELENTRQYLNLFLTHPVYKAYKFLKSERVPENTKTGYAEKKQKVEVNRVSENEGTASTLICTLQTRGEFAEAQEIARNAVNRFPDSFNLLWQLACSYLATGTFWEAERLYRQIAEKWPQRPEAWLGLADLAMSDAKYKDAISYNERVLEFDSGNFAALSGLAMCGLYSPDVNKRVEDLRKIYLNKPLIQSVLSQQELSVKVQQQRAPQNSDNRILFVDQYLPLFDRNAGNHRTYQVLKMIRRTNHPISFVALNGEYQTRYKQELENLGIEPHIINRDELERNYTSTSFLNWWNNLMKEANYPLAILSRYQTANTFLPLIRAFSPETKIVVDTVDLHFLREQRRATLYDVPQMHQHASETNRSELETYRKADALIAVTQDDLMVLQKELGYEKPVHVIPIIHSLEEEQMPFSERRDLVFVGNFAHPPNSDAMYYFCERIFPIVQQKLPEITLYIVGGNSHSVLQNIITNKIILTGYVPSTKPFLDHCRLSINPLRYGAGLKGKIGEAMAHGLPVITTSIGGEGFKIEPGTHALIADTPEEFATAVVQAYCDEGLWNHLSKNGSKLIEELYSPDAVFPDIQSLIDWGFSKI